MIDGIALSTLFAELTGRLISLNDQILLRLNGMAGRSWLFDSLVGLTQENDLIKAGIIGCCFFAAWYGGKTTDEMLARRKILLTTFIAAVCVLGTTKTLSHTIFLPRPLIESQKIYHLSGDNTLVELKRASVRVPLDETSQKDHRDLLNGDVQTNDLGSFPSDHAGFFLAISLGIFLVSRRIGLIALGWTILVILAGKMIMGAHAPVDIAAGGVIAIAEFSVLRFASQSRAGRILDYVTAWTIKHGALSSAIMFAAVFEISSTLFHVRQFLTLLAAARRHMLLG